MRQEVTKSRLSFGPLLTEEATKGQTHSLVMIERRFWSLEDHLKTIFFPPELLYLTSFSHSLVDAVNVIHGDLAMGGKWMKKILSAFRRFTLS